MMFRICFASGSLIACVLNSFAGSTIMAIFHKEPDTETPVRQSLTGTRWRIAPATTAVAAPGHPVIGQMLAARGICSEAEAEAFLHASLDALHDPFSMRDMQTAVEVVLDALTRNARIRIFGDYDADGITATALLVRALGKLGGTVDWYLPHRIDDGYGLNIAALEQAKNDGVEVGITVDNGITAHEQLAHAAALGLRMIVTDHHEPGETLPPAVAVLNPKRADDRYPDRDIAGVGVAFTLLRGLCQARGIPAPALAPFLDLVTIGTIADVAPLCGENRLLVRHGLPQLTLANKKVGIVALLRAVGVQERASCADVGYKIAPRLNAAGRVAHADDALALLITTERTEAETLARQLCDHNATRQGEEQQTLEDALRQVEAQELTREKILVLASEQWHPGVIGIVASRLVERFHRPAILIAVQDGVGKGSGRARAPFHLWEALHSCAPYLLRFGGHRAAAGFEVASSRIDELRAALQSLAEQQLRDEDLTPQLDIDAWIDLEDITSGFAREIEALAPFGMGNPTPVFAAADALVQQCCRRGQDGTHVSLSLRSGPGGRTIPAIWFRQGEQFERLHSGDRVDVAFTVGLNSWQGVTSAQLVIKDIQV